MAENEKDLNFLPEGYKIEIVNSLRQNHALSVNKYGQHIKGLCIASKLGILNRRTTGDFQGHLTYLGYNACGTVDLVVSSEATLLLFKFAILELDILSDQKPVLLTLSK